MEKLTEKQFNYLIKLGATADNIKNLTKQDASYLIGQLAKAKKDIKNGVKTDVVISMPKKENKKVVETKVSTAKKSSSSTAAETKTTKSKPNYETNNKVIEMFLETMRTNKRFLETTSVAENKFDEFAIYVYNYAKKHNTSGGFSIDTDDDEFKKLENNFNKKGFEKCMEELNETKKVGTTTTNTTKSKTKKVVEETNEENEIDDDFDFLADF